MAAKFRLLPAVHEVVAEAAEISEISEYYNAKEITWAVRNILDKARAKILQPGNSREKIFWQYKPDEFKLEFRNWLLTEVLNELKGLNVTLKRVINATGVVLHTNCGRAILAPEVADYVAQQAVHYSNLELDIETGNRGSRYSHVEELLKELTGAEASLVVNNNAAAILLIMNTFANQKEVIVSRGELVEVGGSFRIPEVLKAGGARLVEVGATNKTWLKDYSMAVNDNTAMFLKVHTSNYKIQGFEHSVSVKELVQLGDESGIPVVEDLGSGSFLDGTEFGLPPEPTIQEAVKSGVSLVTFSGDKLLGGPQAGIIVGKRDLIEKLRINQLTRAIRVDKLTLAALIGTLYLYQKKEITKIPIWRILSKDINELRIEAQSLQKKISPMSSLESDILDSTSCVGGGTFPTAMLPTVVCAVKTKCGSNNELERFLRQGRVPILARIFKEKILFDPRTLLPEDEEEIVTRLKEWHNYNLKLNGVNVGAIIAERNQTLQFGKE